MSFLKLFQHLLPDARAWRVTIEKNLRRFFEGLSDAPANAREFIDDVYLDLFPQTTRALDEWEDQFALPDTVPAEQDRRDRLSGVWKALGGQSPRYIQDTLQAAGFPVYVHEWWAPASSPPVARNPSAVLPGTTVIGAVLGNAQMVLGATKAQLGALSLTNDDVIVNKMGEKTPAYPIPADPATYPFFIYLGAATFPNLANIPAARRDEFEALCLKICPSQLWIGVLVNYT